MEKECKKCGKTVNSRFCPGCGTEVCVMIPEEKIVEIRTHEAKNMIRNFNIFGPVLSAVGGVFMGVAQNPKMIEYWLFYIVGNDQMKERMTEMIRNMSTYGIDWGIMIVGLFLFIIGLMYVFMAERYRKMMVIGDLSFV